MSLQGIAKVSCGGIRLVDKGEKKGEQCLGVFWRVVRTGQPKEMYSVPAIFEDGLKRSPQLVSEPRGSRSKISKEFYVEFMKEQGKEDTAGNPSVSGFGIVMTTKKIQEGRLKKFFVFGHQVNEGWSEVTGSMTRSAIPQSNITFVLLYLVNAAGFCYCCQFMISAAKFKVDVVKVNAAIEAVSTASYARY
ncbi:hypothetical protein Tco_1186333 [Tanacetum coccineum]